MHSAREIHILQSN